MTFTNNINAHIIDGGAVTLTVASFAQVVPNIAAVLSVVWFTIRVLETNTVQNLFGKYRWIKEHYDND